MHDVQVKARLAVRNRPQSARPNSSTSTTSKRGGRKGDEKGHQGAVFGAICQLFTQVSLKMVDN
jgi:hypothetical protein